MKIKILDIEIREFVNFYYNLLFYKFNNNQYNDINYHQFFDFKEIKKIYNINNLDDYKF